MAPTEPNPTAPSKTAAAPHSSGPDPVGSDPGATRVPALLLEHPDGERSADRATGVGGFLSTQWRKRRKHRQFAGVAYVFFLTALGHPTRAPWIAGALVVVLGMLVRLWASGIVHKNELLATSGPYGFVRHPLYVGNISIGLGFCLASGLWWSWLGFAVLLWIFYPHTIRYEDQKLRRLFGAPWERWSHVTRALWPRLTPYTDAEAETGGQRAQWSFRLSLARNGEPVHIAVGVLFLWYLHTQIVAG